MDGPSSVGHGDPRSSAIEAALVIGVPKHDATKTGSCGSSAMEVAIRGSSNVVVVVSSTFAHEAGSRASAMLSWNVPFL
jgi:hypothetical protein